MDPYLINDLIREYNNDPSRYTDDEAEIVATLARSIGTDFRRENKAGDKALFDLADTAAFGFLPDEWRPVSRGESVYGETANEKTAGLMGQGLGLVSGGTLAYKGGRGLFNVGKDAAGKVKSKIFGKGGASKASPVSEVRERTLSLGEGQGVPLQLGEGQRLLSGQTGRQVRQNRFPLNQATGQPMPMTSIAGEAIPMEGDVLRYLKGIRRPAPTDAGSTYSKIREFENNMGIGDSYFDRQNLINYAGLNIKPNQLTTSQRNEIIQRLMAS